MTRPKSKLDSISVEEREKVIQELYENQEGICYICRKQIALDTQGTDIDHITALDKGGIDDKNNWGLTHSECNRSKRTKDLQLQRYLSILEEHISKYSQSGDKVNLFTVGDALHEFYPERKPVSLKIDRNKIILFLNVDGKNITEEYPLVVDTNDTSCKSFIGMIPFDCIFHDSTINPRSIVDLALMIEEFYNKNPQLLPSLAHVEFTEPEGQANILLFDGQHKAAAQLYIGNKRLFTRVFVNTNMQKLKEVNFRAHTKLAQIHFPQMISDKVGHDIFEEAFNKFLSKYDYAKQKTEADFFDYWVEPAEKIEYRTYFKNYLKYRALVGEVDGQPNKILGYVETVSARSKKYPLSYDTLTKGFLNNFFYLYPEDYAIIGESQKYRELERKNAIKLMNIFTEEILDGKFEKEKGIFKIEQELKNMPDRIKDAHLRAYRLCRQASLSIWVKELKMAISSLLDARGKYKDSDWREDSPLWAEIDDQEWKRIRKMINVVSQHKLWTEKLNQEVIVAISTTKQSDWKEILLKGRLPGTTIAKYSPLDKNYIFEHSKD